jgi:uncharacterized membrane protein YecN with MAPEG domain
MLVELPPGPTWITLAYVALYYALQVQVLRVKGRLRRAYADRGEKFDRYFGQDREMLAADRVQLNTLEHMPVFLALLWLAAYSVGAQEATIAGAIYLATRIAYPFVLGGRLGRGVPNRIMGVTFTGYGVLAWLAVRIGMSLG